MVKVIFYKKNNEYCGFVSCGHANYSLVGEDIVCASVSSIIIGGMNALKQIKNFDYMIEDGYVRLLAKKDISKYNSIVLNVIKIQLESIEEIKPDNISIKEERMD